MAACAVLALLAPMASHADEHRARRVPPPPEYTQECGSCHLAYPAWLLPASSWQRIMDSLARHYGTDASLDAAQVQRLSTWLQANAATGKRAVPPPEDRITRAAWFQREHDEVPAATWALPAVKSRALCAACHTQAEQGDFSERHIRLPR